MLTRLIKAGDTSEVLLAIALERDLGLKKLNGKVGPRGPFFLPENHRWGSWHVCRDSSMGQHSVIFSNTNGTPKTLCTMLDL